jgi:hypothetical protein
MKRVKTERCRFCLLSLLIMLYFIIMFAPVNYRRIGLMYGYSGFDEGKISWGLLMVEILVASLISWIIYLVYPLKKK